MPIYQYEGQHYDIATSDPNQAREKITSHLNKGKPQEETPKDTTEPKKDLSSGLSYTAGIIPGAAEAVAGGLVGVGESAIEGIAGIGTAIAGKGFKSGFEGTKKALSGVDKLMEPQTEFGKDASKILGLIPEGIHAAGEKVFEKTGSPLAGAATEAIGTGLSLMVGSKLGKAKEVTVEPVPSKITETAFRNKETGEIERSGSKHDEIKKEATADTHEQGFVDEDGKFLTRQEAAERAKQTKQIPEEHKFEKPEEGLHSGDMKTANDRYFLAPNDPNRLDMGPIDSPKTMEESLYGLGKNKEADKVESSQTLQAAEKDGVTPEMKDNWRRYAEGTVKELDQKELELYNKYYSKVAEERKVLTKHVQDKGWVLPTELDETVTGANVARKMVPKQLSPWEKLKAGITESDQGGLNLNIEKTPGAAQERGLFSVEFPNGKRVVIQMKGNDVVQWNKGKMSSLYKGKEGDPSIKAGTKVGEGTVKEATVDELEAHTPYRYNKDTLGVGLERVNELRDFVRSKQLIENIKASPMFKEVSHVIDPKTEIPEGFVRPKYTDKLPEFAGMAFRKDVAAIIEDFARVRDPNVLTKISGALIKNMMLNPLPHMSNEAWHLYNARGLTGWVTPAGLTRFAKTGVPALQEVMTQGEQFRSMLRDGASLLSADVRNNVVLDGFMKQGMKEFVEGAEGKSLLAKYGMKPVELYNALSKKSSTAMWVVRDSMYMQLINEKMLQKGLSQKEAIAEVERHMPNYKIPTEIMKSRKLSETLQNPSVAVFSRYHYGMLRSLGETARDLTGKRGKEAFFEGADTAAAIGVALAVLYPIQDMLAQAMTNNENAKVRRAGPYHPIVALADIAKGEKDPQAFLASVFTANPALLEGVQLLIDRKLYNGQPIYSPTDDPKLIAKDISNYALTQIPQFSTLSKVSDEKRGGGFSQWLAKQADIDSPTKEDVKRKERMLRMKEAASRNKKWKKEHNQ